MAIDQATALRRVGRYEVIREVGRGASAIVYVARQSDLDRLVALKELSGRHAADPTFVERFLRESRLTASLNHPNIVTVHEYFEHDGVAFIAMEYLERGSLRPFVGTLTPPQVAGVLEGLLAGLGHAESKGVVHRDVKPENLMVSSTGNIKIADFGVAKALQGDGSSTLTSSGTAVGTPAYMAPEQALSTPVSPATDLYATGVIAYELLTGDLPYHADVALALLLRHVHDPVPSPAAARRDLDPRLARWVERMLAKQPSERPPTANAAWDDLEEIVVDVLGPRWRRQSRLAQSGVSPVVDAGGRTTATEPLGPVPRRRRRGVWVAGMVAGVAAIAGAGVIAAGLLADDRAPSNAGAAPPRRTTTDTSPPVVVAHADVGGVSFARSADEVVATLRASGRPLPLATVLRHDSLVADGRAWFELRGDGITTSTKGASNDDLRLRVRQARNRLRVDVVTEADAFAGFRVRRVDGRTVAVTVIRPKVIEPSSTPTSSSAPESGSGSGSGSRSPSPTPTTTEPQQTTPESTRKNPPLKTG